MLYSYKSAEPVEPPEPADIVAFGLVKPAQITVPLAGVARFKTGFTVAELKDQLAMVVGPLALHP